MKRFALLALFMIVVLLVGTGCEKNESPFDTGKSISVVSREDGSGTRGAFISLLGIEVKGDGKRKDRTTKEATIAKQTDIMISNVSEDPYAIGYISLGSLNDTIKTTAIDGILPSSKSIKDGSYSISRSFNIATKGEAIGVTKDFINFILSAEGQSIVGKSYISTVENPSVYSGSKPSGKIVVAGSSSVTPVMEKLKEAYIAVNPNATIEIQQSDSTAGITGVMDGTCNIGMSSRDLTDSELEQLKATEIALDGIAVIVNKGNPVSNLTKEQVKNIYLGEITKWGDIK